MTVPSNFLVQVQTYQPAHLALLLNYGCFIHTANKKFNDFDRFAGNLGATVTFDIPVRMYGVPSLVAQFQGIQQNLQSLTVSQKYSVSYEFTGQQYIFNVDDYMQRLGISAVAELATHVEADVASLCETQPYRFYGDGVTQINSIGQLAQMLAQFKTYGFAHSQIKAYLSDVAVPQIVNSGLNQFVMTRNEDIAMSWMVSDWNQVSWYQSNLLPIHTAGSVGNTPSPGNVLQVVSTNDPLGANITQITFSGADVSDPNAIAAYDSLQLVDNPSSYPIMRYLTYVGHQPSSAFVQIQATAQAGSTAGGEVTVNIYPPLCSQGGNANQNLQYNITAGMQFSVLPSHRCGLIVGGDALYLAMPRLPEQPPFPTSSTVDEETGASVRLTYGSTFGQNQIGFVNDAIWAKTAVPQYLMKIAFPL